MEKCPQFQQTITALANTHGLEWERPGSRIELRNNGYMPLVIERPTPMQLSVYHYFTHGRAAIADPRVTVYTGEQMQEWVPMGITQTIGGPRLYARLSVQEPHLLPVDVHGQADLTEFIEETWQQNIREQGWLEQGRVVEPDSPESVSNYARLLPETLFPVGRVVATPGADALLTRTDRHPITYMTLHGQGYWGELPAEDAAANERALEHGGRIFSAYMLGDEKMWVITEADRSATTFLQPSEY